MECAILVVSAVDGLTPFCRQHLLIAKHLEISRLIVYFNKLDDPNYDAELQEFLQISLGSFLSGALEEHAIYFWIGNGRNGKTRSAI